MEHQNATVLRPVNPATRWLFLMIGCACIALGYIGIPIPGMPSTVFFLTALWAFKRSSPRLEEWLLYRSPVASILQDWERDQSMTLRTKVVAISMIWTTISVSMGIILYRGKSLWVVALLGITALALTLFLVTRKTKDANPVSR